MAEALARHFIGARVNACSAGLVPLGYIPSLTFEVLKEAGISAKGLYSKGIADVQFDCVDYLVNLTGIAIASRMPQSFRGKVISFFIQDPFGGDVEEFRDVRNQIEWMVREKLPELISLKEDGSR